MNTNDTIFSPEVVLYANLTYTSVNAGKIVTAKTIGDDIAEDLYKINDESGTCRKCFFKTFKNMSNYRSYDQIFISLPQNSSDRNFEIKMFEV